MFSFELLPHTADVKMLARGSNPQELLSAAVKGMFAAAEPQYVPGATRVRRTIDVTSSDFPSLIVDTLGEIIAVSDASHEAYEDADWDEVTDTHARGTVIGRPVSSFGTQIKAATYHDLAVRQTPQGMWEANVTFDV